MRKLTITTILISCALSASAQFSNSQIIGINSFFLRHNTEYNRPIEDKTIILNRQKNNIQEKTTLQKNKRNKIVSTTIETYNNQGRTTSLMIKKSNYKLLLSYCKDSLIEKMTEIIKSDTTITQFNYDNENKFNGLICLKNGKIKTKVIITKNNENQITNRLTLYGKNLKKSTEMVYIYEGKDLIKSQYFRNKKLIHEWNYDCKPEGEIVNLKKTEQNTICSWKEEIAGGGYISYSRITDIEDPEKIYLNKFYFSADSVNYKTETFYKEKILIYRTEKNETTERISRYSNKGKPTFSNIYLYKDNLISNSTSIVHRRKCTVFSTDFQYNSKNLMTSSLSINNNRIKYSTEIDYQYF